MDRRAKGYRMTVRKVFTFCFIMAKMGGGCVALQDIFVKFPDVQKKDIAACMNNDFMREIFAREITSNGTVFHLNGNFRYMEFDEANAYVNKQMNKRNI